MGVSGASRPVFIEEFEQVLAAEYAAVRERRSINDIKTETPDKKDAAPPELFGVALSGGGIRSASFCLGALQALDQHNLIERIDYLSTVSGGGYTGASMIAAMTDWESKPKQDPDKVPYFPFSAGKDADVRDSEPISHIRDHSRYLTPKGFADFGVSVAIILRGLLVNVLLLLTLLLPLSTLIVLTNPTAAHLDHSILYDIATYVIPPTQQSGAWWEWTRYFLTDPLIITKFLAVLLGYWLVGWALWRSYAEDNNRRNDALVLEFGGVGARIGRLLIVGLLVAFVVELQPIIIAWVVGFLGRGSSGGSWLTGLTAALGSAAAATAFFRERLVGWIQRALNSPTIGTRVQAWLAWAGFYALGLALPLLIYGAFLLLTIWGIQLAENCGTSAGVFGIRFPENCGGELSYLHTPGMLTSTKTVWLLVLSIFFMMAVVAVSYTTSGAKQEKPKAAKKRKIENISSDLTTLIVAVLVIFCVVLSAYSTRPDSNGSDIYTNPQWVVLVNYILLSALVVFVGWCFSENANGLHRLYRDRLRVAFRFDKAGGGSLPLHELGEKCPYILVNGTLNVRSPNDRDSGAGARPQDRKLESPDPAKRGRNAEFFLFSKYFVGSASTGYAASKTLSEEQTELDLAACVAISGAAVSSSMGRISVGLLGPTLSLLNVRLGFWLKNPRGLKGLQERQAQKAEATQNPADVQPVQTAADKAPEADPDPAEDEPAKRHWVDRLRLYLFAEAFGLLRSDSSRIYITDGGHIDNIGLYQLLKRRCSFIVVIDAEADPGLNFGAFCDVQRFIRIDEGVRVSLNWQPVRTAAVKRSADRTAYVPPESDLHNRHFAIGEIRYEDASKDEKPGILLYVKASMTGDEPDYVLDYERRYPRFPHESTGDQFFSEEQMEAYRALGFHAMRVALREQEEPANARVKGPVASAIPILLDLDDAAIAAASAGVRRPAIVLAPVVSNERDEEVDKQAPATTPEPPKEDQAALLKRFKQVLRARESIETPKRLSNAPRGEQPNAVEQ